MYSIIPTAFISMEKNRLEFTQYTKADETNYIQLKYAVKFMK